MCTGKNATLPNRQATFHREGDTSADLLVSFQLAGSALNGLDYETNSQTVLLPAGRTNLDLSIRPLDDTLSEPVETVVLTLNSSDLYDLDVPSAATIQIADTDPAVVRVTALRSNAYERLALDTLIFAVERWGETNSALSIGYRLDAGTATPGVDFQGVGGAPLPQVIELAPGQVQAILELEPIDDGDFEENETVILQLLPGSGYGVGPAGAATAWIVDDELPALPATSLLFSDDFERGTQDKWQIRFGANNGVEDYRALFNFDYRRLGIPPSPHSAPGSSLGLFLQVNKDDPTPGGSAGINLYPKGLSVAGNFGLRFDLFVNMGPAAPTEHAIAGINHSGLLTNRVSQSIDQMAQFGHGNRVLLCQVPAGV